MRDHESDCGPHFKKLVRDVDEFGWHVVLVREDDEGPGFAYTVGVYKNLKQPEIIMIGLKLDVLHPVLNGIVEDMKKGKRFKTGKRYSDVIEGFDCVFRTVHGSHYDDYLGQAIRFYGGSTFPVVQCIWPDKKARFPWDKDATPHLGRQQPLLDSPWPFKEPRNLAVFTTRQVLDEGLPVLVVAHDEEDGAWQFLCGTSELKGRDARIVCLEEMFKHDPTLGDLADLPLGWRASRDGNGPWKRERNAE